VGARQRKSRAALPREPGRKIFDVTDISKTADGRNRKSRNFQRIYPASKARYWPFWCALRSAGIPIYASWIDAPFNRDEAMPSDDEGAEHWACCISEATAADVVLFYAGANEMQCGALLEVGAALSAGKQVFCVSPYTWSFSNHPRCPRFGSLAEAVEAAAALDEALP
jgi:hypothetical protein